MKVLLFLLCGAAFAAPVVTKKPAQPIPAKAPSDAAIKSAVQNAVQAHVNKYKIGGMVIGSSATVQEVRPMSGWTGKYSVTGSVSITVKTSNGNQKQTRTFSATAETEGGTVKVSDVSV